jgi:hypothetical protein
VEKVRDTLAMVAGMEPVIRDPVWVYCHSDDPVLIAAAIPHAFGVVREELDTTLILERAKAQALGFDCSMPMRQITLQVFSALDASGLTAAFAPPLAAAGIPCNVVAGFHHDHLLVPAGRADQALRILLQIQAAAAPGPASSRPAESGA